MPVFHRISILGRHVVETRTVAWTVTRIVCAELLLETSEASSFGVRQNKKVGLSFGLHMRGNRGARPFPISSAEPSDNCILTRVMAMSSFEKAPVSTSSDAITEGLPALPLEFEYRTRLEIAGRPRKAICVPTLRLLSLMYPSWVLGLIPCNLDAASLGSNPFSAGSPFKDSSRLNDPGTPLGSRRSLDLSLTPSFSGIRVAESLKKMVGEWSLILGRLNRALVVHMASMV